MSAISGQWGSPTNAKKVDLKDVGDIDELPKLFRKGGS